MRVRTLLSAAVLAAGLTSALAAGRVEVSFDKPERFADAGFGDFERERTLKGLSDAMQSLGKRLPDGQTLRIEVTEVDLAGETWPWAGRDLRIVRGRADWPRMDLRWSLLEGTRTVKAGQAQLSDMAYTFGSPRAADMRDGFAYERRMLRQWFDANFVSSR